MPLLRINHSPSRRQLWVFSAAAATLAGVGAVMAFARGHENVGWSGAAVSGAFLLAGWQAPSLARLCFLLLSYVTYPIGFVLSHVIVAVVYFGVMLPIGLAMRLAGRDPLERKLAPEAQTYWQRRPANPEPSSYLRQR